MEARRAPAFATLLRQFRTAAGLSQEKLAERTGLSVRGISDLERGSRRRPRLDTVRLLADALDLPAPDRARFFAAVSPAQRDPAPLSRIASPPIPPTPLVGRTVEIAGITRILRGGETRLITLAGPGGVGKTRLATEIATVLAPEIDARVVFVPLAMVDDPDLVVPALARAMGLPDPGQASAFADIVTTLQVEPTLLILDNFEHLLPAADVVANLLAACADLRILVTSRSPLHLRGEQEWPLDPLPVPEEDGAQSPERIADVEAVRLFTDRVIAVHPRFSLTPDNVDAVAGICRWLDGVPLALELAAAQATILSPHGLLTHLRDQRLAALEQGHRDLPPRQRTMRRTIGWSYDLLDPPARALFRRLAVFSGPWTASAAIAIAGSDATPDVLGSLRVLVDASLVRPLPEGPVERQFEMLDIIREFALEQLAASGDGNAARDAHAAWVAGMVDEASVELVGPNRALWLARLAANIGNLRAALGWTLMHGQVATTVRLVSAIWLSWFEHGHATEARSWLVRALHACDEDDVAVRADALSALGSLAGTQLDYDPAEACLRQALDLWRRLGAVPQVAQTAHTLGIITLEAGHDARALELLEEASGMYAGIPELRDSPWAALVQSQIAAALSRLGKTGSAQALARAARRRQEGTESSSGVAIADFYLGDIALDRAELEEAWVCYAKAINVMRENGDHWHLLHSLPAFTIVAAMLLPPRRAALLIGAERRARRETAHGIPRRYRSKHDEAVARVRDALGDEAFEDALAEGEALGLDAVLEALLERSPSAREGVCD